MKETKEALQAAITHHTAAAEFCRRALNAEALDESIATKEKAVAQLEQRIEELTQTEARVTANMQAEIGTLNRELGELQKRVAALKTKYGDALRFDELKQKNAEQEAQLRDAHKRWEEFKQKLHGAVA
jgi:hypothetical protein